jgi:HEAT repeat protein
MLDDCDPAFRWAAVRGLSHFPGPETTEALLRHAGTDADLDLAIFKTLLHEPDVHRPILQATADGLISPSTAVTFVIGFLAEQHLPADAYPDVGAFLARHFGNEDIETKHAVLAVCRHGSHPALHQVIQSGVTDPDPAVHAAALEAAQAIGLPPLFDVATSEDSAHS